MNETVLYPERRMQNGLRFRYQHRLSCLPYGKVILHIFDEGLNRIRDVALLRNQEIKTTEGMDRIDFVEAESCIRIFDDEITDVAGCETSLRQVVGGDKLSELQYDLRFKCVLVTERHRPKIEVVFFF